MRRINQCFNALLNDLCQQADELKRLNTLVRSYLPVNLREYCFVSGFTKGCLLLSTTDAVWASQLRYSLPQLRDKLRQEGKIYQLTTIKVTVASSYATESKKPKPALKLSENARGIILAGAEQCDYPPLKEAWQSLINDQGEKY